MSHKPQFSPEALRDLEEINEYIAEELSNPDAALHVINRILDAAERLESYPESGAALTSATHVPNGYRFLPVEQYLLFYRVQAERVYIDRILYGRRDYARILFNPPKNS